MMYQAISQQTRLMPFSPSTYGLSYATVSRPVAPSAHTGIMPGASRAPGPRGHRPCTTTGPRLLDPCGVQRGCPHPCGALAPLNPKGKALSPRERRLPTTPGRRKPPVPGARRSVEVSAPGVLARPMAALTHRPAPPAAWDRGPGAAWRGPRRQHRGPEPLWRVSAGAAAPSRLRGPAGPWPLACGTSCRAHSAPARNGAPYVTTESRARAAPARPLYPSAQRGKSSRRRRKREARGRGPRRETEAGGAEGFRDQRPFAGGSRGL